MYRKFQQGGQIDPQEAINNFVQIPEVYAEQLAGANKDFPADQLVQAVKQDPEGTVQALAQDKELLGAIVQIYSANKQELDQYAAQSAQQSQMFAKGGKMTQLLERFQQGGKNKRQQYLEYYADQYGGDMDLARRAYQNARRAGTLGEVSSLVWRERPEKMSGIVGGSQQYAIQIPAPVVASPAPIKAAEVIPSVNMDKLSFNQAFGEARKQGLDIFEWRGKKYGTQLAGEESASSQSGATQIKQNGTLESATTSSSLPKEKWAQLVVDGKISLDDVPYTKLPGGGNVHNWVEGEIKGLEIARGIKVPIRNNSGATYVEAQQPIVYQDVNQDTGLRVIYDNSRRLNNPAMPTTVLGSDGNLYASYPDGRYTFVQGSQKNPQASIDDIRTMFDNWKSKSRRERASINRSGLNARNEAMPYFNQHETPILVNQQGGSIRKSQNVNLYPVNRKVSSDASLYDSVIGPKTDSVYVSTGPADTQKISTEKPRAMHPFIKSKDTVPEAIRKESTVSILQNGKWIRLDDKSK